MLQVIASNPILGSQYEAECMLTVDSQIDLQDMEAVFDMEWLKLDGVYYVQKLTYII